MGTATKLELIDRSGRVRPPPRAALGAELRGLLRRGMPRPDPAGLPLGDGAPVLVIPGFGEGDLMLRPFRRWLDDLNYFAHGWGQGPNIGPKPRVFERLLARLDEIHARFDRPVILIGISLGGVFARVLAHARPNAVAQVVTLASPFRLPARSSIELLYQALTPLHAPLPPWVQTALLRPPPVRTTAFYTRNDGIVPWQCCLDEPGEGRENVEVTCGHLLMPSNPIVLRLVAERIAPGAAKTAQPSATPAPVERAVAARAGG